LSRIHDKAKITINRRLKSVNSIQTELLSTKLPANAAALCCWIAIKIIHTWSSFDSGTDDQRFRCEWLFSFHGFKTAALTLISVEKYFSLKHKLLAILRL
jgi:hypothetical protein